MCMRVFVCVYFALAYVSIRVCRSFIYLFIHFCFLFVSLFSKRLLSYSSHLLRNLPLTRFLSTLFFLSASLSFCLFPHSSLFFSSPSRYFSRIPSLFISLSFIFRLYYVLYQAVFFLPSSPAFKCVIRDNYVGLGWQRTFTIISL